MNHLESMPYIYNEIDQGRTVCSLANEMGVSARSLYRWHNQYQKQTGGQRKSLTDGRGSKKRIVMADVYKQLDAGKSVVTIARKLGVSTKTIYRHAASESGESK